VLSASALLGPVVPFVSAAIAPVVSTPTTFRTEAAAEAVPPCGARTTSGLLVMLTWC
jgi:hypothetical protein